MNAALRADPGARRVNLTVPTTVIRVGPLAFDGLSALIGAPLADVLEPMMVGPMFQRPGDNGGVVDVYPLALPHGEGMSIPVRLMGEIGFRNHHGVLILVLPAALAEITRERLSDEIAAGQAAGPRFVEAPGGGIAAEFAVTLRSGMRKSIPFGRWGEIGMEAA